MNALFLNKQLLNEERIEQLKADFLGQKRKQDFLDAISFVVQTKLTVAT